MNTVTNGKGSKSRITDHAAYRKSVVWDHLQGPVPGHKFKKVYGPRDPGSPVEFAQIPVDTTNPFSTICQTPKQP